MAAHKQHSTLDANHKGWGRQEQNLVSIRQFHKLYILAAYNARPVSVNALYTSESQSNLAQTVQQHLLRCMTGITKPQLDALGNPDQQSMLCKRNARQFITHWLATAGKSCTD